jgi:MoxR-like ATPase
MNTEVFQVDRPEELRRAGPSDLVALLPAPGANPLFLPKWLLEVVVRGLADGEMIHLSGPTASAKSSLIEALGRVPENFLALCRSLAIEARPLRLYPVEMAVFEAPGELYQLRAIEAGTSGFEPSVLVRALRAAEACRDEARPVIWLREIGRVQTAAVQGGLLNLMCRGEIRLPEGAVGGTIDGRGIAWIADSNYQATESATHTLVVLDDALRRRFTLNVTLDYLPPAQEMAVLARLHPRAAAERIEAVVRLGEVIRRRRADGELASVAPPTLYGYDAFLRLGARLPGLSLQRLAAVTLLGNATADDARQAALALAEVVAPREAAAGDRELAGGALI